MTAAGQNAKNSHGAYLVRFTLHSDRRADIRNRQLRAITGHEQSQQINSLFDHLVGAGEQRRRYLKAERFGFELAQRLVLELGR
jgi:hypothetical protein